MTLFVRGLALTGLLFAALVPAMAEEIQKPTKGDVTFDLATTISVDRNGIRPTEEAFAGFSVYLNDYTQLGLTVGFLPSDFLRLGPIDLTLNMDLMPIDSTGETVPYIGIGAGLADVDNVSFDVADIRTKGQYGFQAGVKHYFSNNLAFFGEVNYRTRGNIDDGRTIGMFGVKVIL